MKLDEFINKYINTKVDFNNAFGAQCVDLYRQYCKKELKDTQKAWRDMTDLPDYPDINFPLYIPSFLKVKTFSTHTKGEDR